MSADTTPELSDREWLFHLIGKEIAAAQRQVAGEREAPRHDADRSDDVIKEGRNAVKDLRRIRQELEIVFFGAIE